jgi:hypothetical protein
VTPALRKRRQTHRADSRRVLLEKSIRPNAAECGAAGRATTSALRRGCVDWSPARVLRNTARTLSSASWTTRPSDSPLHERLRNGSQFIVSTHSSILLDYPDARIYVLSEDRINRTRYKETEQCELTRPFLDGRRFLHYVFIDD